MHMYRNVATFDQLSGSSSDPHPGECELETCTELHETSRGGGKDQSFFEGGAASAIFQL